jgi:hypothetical protein
MKTRLFLFGAICIAAVNVPAAQLKIVKVNAPAINYLFSSNGTVTVSDTVAQFTTNLPPYATSNLPNASLSGFLQSRTYAGLPGTPEAGLNAYEYRLVLKSLTGAKSVALNSMTLKFSPYSSFTYNGQTNKQVWVVTSGGLGSVGPNSAATSGSKVTFTFNPPFTFSSVSNQNQETSSYFFGMISPTKPPPAAKGWASFTGTEKLTGGGTVPFNFLMLPVRTP